MKDRLKEILSYSVISQQTALEIIRSDLDEVVKLAKVSVFLMQTIVSINDKLGKLIEEETTRDELNKRL